MMRLGHRDSMIRPRPQRLGFTFVEVLIALCVVLIALVPLIHLHVNSIRQVAVATCVARATLLADSKVAEAVAQNVLECGKWRGRADDTDLPAVFQWVLTVSDAVPPELEGRNLLGMRHIHVDVAWRDGSRERMVSLDTLVKTAVQHESRISDPQDDGQQRRTSIIPNSERRL